MVTRRTQPLTARRSAPAAVVPPLPFDAIDDAIDQSFPTAPPLAPPTLAPPSAPLPVAKPETVVRSGDDAGRFQRLADGIRGLRVGGGTLNLGERTLMIIGGILAPIGLLLVLLGWWGAAHTPNLYEQIPYVASGGLFGLGLVFLGAFFYFAHWITELVKESRGQSAAMIEAIARLEETVRQQAGLDRLAGATNGSVSGHQESAFAPVEDDRELVATNRGTMAHRPDCVVVAGKPSLRRVAVDDALEPCKLCDPYAD